MMPIRKKPIFMKNYNKNNKKTNLFHFWNLDFKKI